jgi:hypothetical protein
MDENDLPDEEVRRMWNQGDPVRLAGPEGWTRLLLGNLTGATTWCARCKAHTDHNGAWCDKYLKAG